jgi:hypothetical protein
MSELGFLLNFLPKNEPVVDDDKTGQPKITGKDILKIVYILLFLGIQIVLWAWAISVAMEISSPTTDSRVLHLMFAFMSPTLYLLIAYTKRDIWPDSEQLAPLCTPIRRKRRKK